MFMCGKRRESRGYLLANTCSMALNGYPYAAIYPRIDSPALDGRLTSSSALTRVYKLVPDCLSSESTEIDTSYLNRYHFGLRTNGQVRKFLRSKREQFYDRLQAHRHPAAARLDRLSNVSHCVYPTNQHAPSLSDTSDDRKNRVESPKLKNKRTAAVPLQADAPSSTPPRRRLFRFKRA